MRVKPLYFGNVAGGGLDRLTGLFLNHGCRDGALPFAPKRIRVVTDRGGGHIGGLFCVVDLWLRACVAARGELRAVVIVSNGG